MKVLLALVLIIAFFIGMLAIQSTQEGYDYREKQNNLVCQQNCIESDFWVE